MRPTLRRLALGAAVAAPALAAALALLIGVSLLRVPVEPAVDLPGQRAFEVRDTTGARVAVRGVAGTPATPPDAVPEVLADAVIAIEDRRFRAHWGLDPVGVARAAWTNLTAGEVRQGGSTITQQLAKLAYLSGARTFTRKVQEAALAMWLEARLSKDEILRRYLGHAYFGGGAYGVTAAARRYFDKPLAELSLAEAAMLAGLIRAPSRLNPVEDRESAVARAGLVLDAMVATGRLSREAAAAAKASPARLAAPLAEGELGPHFASWAERRAHDRLGEAYGDFTLRTTLEPELQRIAERRTRELLDERAETATQAALVALRPDGAVAAMVGGRDYAESQFNRAAQARRQPGSLFKTFVYLAALDRGLSPRDRMVDEPVEIDGWRPRNYGEGHRGPVTLETAFAQSINTVAVKLSERVGRARVIAAARRLGLGPNLPDVPSLALGTAETSLLKITGAYAAIAADDAGLRPYGLRAITSGGVRLYQRARRQRGRPVADSPGTRAALLELLRAVVTDGTGRAAAVEGLRVHGKTGTSQGQRDAWFVGFVDGLTVGVWVGRDDAARTGATGGGLPARLWRAVVRDAREQGLLAPGAARRPAAPRVAALPTDGDATPEDRARPDEAVPAPTPPARKPAPATAEPSEPGDSGPSDDGSSEAPRGTADRAPEATSPDPAAPSGGERDTPAPPPVLSGPARVLDTATLAIDGRIAKLYGVGRGTERFTGAMADYVGGRPVTCRHVRARAYRCEVGGYDLSEVVVHNGGARAASDAPPALDRAEARARQAGRGLWAR